MTANRKRLIFGIVKGKVKGINRREYLLLLLTILNEKVQVRSLKKLYLLHVNDEVKKALYNKSDDFLSEFLLD